MNDFNFTGTSWYSKFHFATSYSLINSAFHYSNVMRNRNSTINFKMDLSNSVEL